MYTLDISYTFLISLICSVLVFILAVIFIFIIIVKRNKTIVKIASLRQRFLTLNKTPIKIKLEKISSFVQKEPKFAEAITYWNERYQKIMVEEYKKYTELLKTIIDNLNNGDNKKMRKNINLATKNIRAIEIETSQLHEELTKAMEIENIQIIKIVNYKNIFQKLSNMFDANQKILEKSKKKIISNMHEIKLLFEKFDVFINKSELEHSAKVLEKITSQLLLLARSLDVLPMISSFHKHIIDQRVNELKIDYKKFQKVNETSEIKNIDFDKKIKDIVNSKITLLNKITNLEISPAEEISKKITLQLDLLETAISNSNLSKEIFIESLNPVHKNYKKIIKNYDNLILLVNNLENKNVFDTSKLTNKYNKFTHSYYLLLTKSETKGDFINKTKMMIKFIKELIDLSDLIKKDYKKLSNQNSKIHIIIQNIHIFSLLVADIELIIKKQKIKISKKDQANITDLLRQSHKFNLLIDKESIKSDTDLSALRQTISIYRRKAYQLYYYVFNFIQVDEMSENAFICANRFNKIRYHYKLNNVLQTAEIVYKKDKLAALEIITKALEEENDFIPFNRK